jgi:hypothetical protein
LGADFVIPLDFVSLPLVATDVPPCQIVSVFGCNNTIDMGRTKEPEELRYKIRGETVDIMDDVTALI